MANKEQPTTTRVTSEEPLLQRGVLYDLGTQVASGVTVVGVTVAAKHIVDKLKPPKDK